MRNYRKIRAWMEADDLTVLIYQHTKSFPREELYGLTSQLRRAAYSVPSNIAEGSARGTNRDYLHFLHIARASLTETQYFVHLSKRLGYLSDEDAQTLGPQMKSAFVRLYGLIEAVGKEIDSVGCDPVVA
jgi:four helix bundle protein